MRTTRLLPMLFVVVTSLGTAMLCCAKLEAPQAGLSGRPEATKGSSDMAADSRVSMASARAEEAPSVPADPTRGRILVKTGSVMLVVVEAEPALEKLRELMAAHGAFEAGRVSSAMIPHSKYLVPSEVREVTLTLKIPADRFDTFLDEVKKIGSYTSEQVSVEDVTFQYVDLEARLASQQKVEQRLLSHLETGAKELKDIVEVERELARVREQVESLTGQLKLLRDRVAFSTLALTLSVQADWVPPVERTFWQQLSDRFVGSVEALWETAKMAVIVVLAALPWLIVLCVAGWVLWRILRFLRGRAGKKGGAERKGAAGPPAASA